MERKGSPWAVALTVAGLLVVLVAGYAGLYWWRLPYAFVWPTYGNEIDVRFPSRFETEVFAPTVWVHSRIHLDSLIKRSGPIFPPLPP